MTFFKKYEQVIIQYLVFHSIKFMRISLGILFVWFGSLKAFGVSPVEDFVSTVLQEMPFKLTVSFWAVSKSV